ncbi:sensor histidine kinase [Sideroxydans lithotrophicus]|uniref:histidine kinase n=1 Tax=Sideroxydans lithotrophicus (strain ES-1) TaxID=580332 RepID=D5CTE8_SIDLE|nr:ATP-binding protein [Sideroxydans lithotrophicus]ADE10254.1 multi-sensor signal transduction histidine kinase [Sideroxydans lithotrophicus ES-1]
MKYLVIISGIVGAALLYLLSSASANTDLFSHNYYVLLVMTGVLALALAGLVASQIWQLRTKLKKKVYGAKLTLRLVTIFSVIAILPGFLVYAVSVQFLSKSIESWFDVRVEKALEGGLNLGRSSLENGLTELGKKGHLVAILLSEQEPQRHSKTLARLIEEGGAQEAAVFGNKGQLLAFASSGNQQDTEKPTNEMLHQAWEKDGYSMVEVLPDDQLALRVLIPMKSTLWKEGQRTLQFMQLVPKQIAADAETVQDVYRDYQELSLSRLGLKRLYGITLTLSLLIVLLSVSSAAFYLSEQLSAPLAALASGTLAVSQGDFSGNYPVQSRDELGALTGLFNQMTRYLADAKRTGEQQQLQVENAKVYLESVLAHLSSGVMVVDEQHRLRSSNPSANQILGVPLQMVEGKTLSEIAAEHALLRSFIEAVTQGFEESTQYEWRQQIERMSKSGDQILLLRGTRLSTMQEDSSYVVVFDDITHLLQAERQAAWGEVARRLAHEIKNPLTPIQLSAERLQHKLLGKLDEHDSQLLQRATQTIVSQVAAMKNMVTEFANYARAPAARMVALDIHQLLNEVMGLYEANSSPITLQLNAHRTWLNGDATRLRQVIHNLLQNAHDALQQTEHPMIVLSTENTTNGTLKLIVRDNGSGIPEHMLGRLFEPYMTTKQKGTGLGLAIVKKIVEEHGGKITIESQPLAGTRISVELPLAVTETEML